MGTYLTNILIIVFLFNLWMSIELANLKQLFNFEEEDRFVSILVICMNYSIHLHFVS